MYYGKHPRGQGCVKPISISELSLASVAIPASWFSYHTPYFENISSLETPTNR